MQQRSKAEICLPLALFLVASLASVPTLIIAVTWMTIGVCTIGYRQLSDFPNNGIPRRWLHGRRSACLWFYHLAFWPRYKSAELRAIGTWVAGALGMSQLARLIQDSLPRARQPMRSKDK
jgi:hypothetical protein